MRATQDWLRTHRPANETAPALAKLLDSGGSLRGLTITDELTLGLNGENFHYGTPIHPWEGKNPSSCDRRSFGPRRIHGPKSRRRQSYKALRFETKHLLIIETGSRSITQHNTDCPWLSGRTAILSLLIVSLEGRRPDRRRRLQEGWLISRLAPTRAVRCGFPRATAEYSGNARLMGESPIKAWFRSLRA